MNKWEYDIEDLLEAYEQKNRYTPDRPPVLAEEITLRKKLIEEETQELLEAIDDGYLPNIAKEIIDVLVVTIGAARTYGINLSLAWDEVHKSNMHKRGGPRDPITGKQLKPKGWKKPDMEKVLEDQGWLKGI
jgi:predicted HAD superfamily Cof-like phosphohydrolase